MRKLIMNIFNPKKTPYQLWWEGQEKKRKPLIQKMLKFDIMINPSIKSDDQLILEEYGSWPTEWLEKAVEEINKDNECEACNSMTEKLHHGKCFDCCEREYEESYLNIKRS